MACVERVEGPSLGDVDVELTFLHTADVHSRLLPYRAQLFATDQRLGLSQDAEPFGGIARIAHVIKRQRAMGDRVVYVDSGDCFQGAPIFNAFRGEVEIRSLSHLVPDAVVIGNHEFDEGVVNYAHQLADWATFPVIAANYWLEPDNPLIPYVQPVSIADVRGVKVGFIGVANFSSISSITDVGNSIGVIPLNNTEEIQKWIDVLRPQVDLIVAVSHAGLHEDEDIIQHTTGLDIVFGGHLHIVLEPPKVVEDACGRGVLLVHSGAFAKYVGQLDVITRPGERVYADAKFDDPQCAANRVGREIVAHDYTLFPIDSRTPEDPLTLDLVEPYRLKLNQAIDLQTVYGFTPRLIHRFDFDGGDSPLGNFVAEAIRKRAWADFGMTNSLGIRTDLFPGPITLDDLFNVFPFNNSITTMYLSGRDIQALLDFATRRAAGRGCATQIQVAGIGFTMNCGTGHAENIYLTNCGDPNIEDRSLCTKEPLDPDRIYEMATNDYIAEGGSGFTVLKINNTQVDTGVQLRDAVLEDIVRSPACSEECRGPDNRLHLAGCDTYEACVASMTSYLGQFCDHVADTAPDDRRVPAHCGESGTACATDGDCLRLDQTCKRDPGACHACASSADCAPQETCYQGWCVAYRAVCVEGRCRPRCKVREHCQAAASTPDAQHLCVEAVPGAPSTRFCDVPAGAVCHDTRDCVEPWRACFGSLPACGSDADCDADATCTDGLCVPRRTACEADSDCTGGLVCVNGWCAKDEPAGTCGPCQRDADCPSGHVCASGLCVVPVALCREGHCRLSCAGDTDCLPGHGCVDGACVPVECTVEVDAETACRIEAAFRAEQQCLTMPCPRAESDGRIKRVLPANLGNLPPDLVPDDPDG